MKKLQEMGRDVDYVDTRKKKARTETGSRSQPSTDTACRRQRPRQKRSRTEGRDLLMELRL